MAVFTKPKTVFILFPLLTMILLSVVNVGGITSEGGGSNIYGGELRNMCSEAQLIIDNLEYQHNQLGVSLDDYTSYQEEQAFASAQERLDKTEGYIQKSKWSDALFKFGTVIGVLKNFLNSDYSDSVQSRIRDLRSRHDSLDKSYSEISDWGGGFFTSTSGRLLFLGVIFGLISFVILISIRVFSSGIAGESISIIVKSLIFLGIWMMLSGGSWSLVLAINVVGKIIWGFLTFLYFMGVILNIR